MKKPVLRYLPSAKETVKRLNPAIKPMLKAAIEDLLDNPYSSKELVDEFTGFRSLAIGRYRVIYRYNEPSYVEILLIGHRRDVYLQFRTMLENIKSSVH